MIPRNGDRKWTGDSSKGSEKSPNTKMRTCKTWEASLLYFLVACPWAGYCTSLGLSFFICNVRIETSHFKGCWED